MKRRLLQAHLHEEHRALLVKAFVLRLVLDLVGQRLERIVPNAFVGVDECHFRRRRFPQSILQVCGWINTFDHAAGHHVA